MSGVEIRVRSNSRQARQDLSQLERSVGNIEKTARSVTTTFQRLAIGIGAAFSGTALTRSINGATNSLTNLENRIALITGRGKEMNAQLDALFKIAKETKAPVDATVETFNRFARSLLSTGKTAEEVNRAVRAVGLATTISGGSAESTRAALFQLGQGLASGQLRGQELNSVLEQAPRLARVIADGLDVPFGSLRKIAEQGQITTEVVFESLISQTQKLEEEFANVALTSDKAFSILRDQISRVVGEISKQLGFTDAFTTRIVALTDFIEQNRREIVASVVNSGRFIASSFEGVFAVLNGVGRIVTAIAGRLADALPNLTTPFRDFSQVIFTEFAGAVLYTNALLKRFGLDIEAIFDSLFNTRFQGAIREIFRSRSLKEFGNALYSLGEALDSYGRRWYNFSNFAERALRSTNVLLYETGIYLGIVDQTLFRLRYTSFERFGKAFGVVGDILRDVARNIAASNIFVTLQVSVIKATQLVTNFGKALDNISGNRISAVIDTVRKTFISVYDSAYTNMTKASKVINDALVYIERRFAWAYDKIIGNSWWSDTMEQTYELAQKWLPKTTEFISSFTRQISELYRYISLVLSSDFNTKTKFELIVGGIAISAQAKAQAAKEIAATLATSVADGAANILNSIRELSPQIAGFLSLGFAAGLTKAISPDLFKSSFGRLGPFLAVALSAGLLTAFDGAILKSGLFESVARGLGNSIGTGIKTIVENIPAILKLLIRVANEFGKGLAESIGNSLIGLPAKIISFLPGGGLMTTLLYGGLTAAVFFSNFRKFLITNVKSVLTGIGAEKGSGLLYNLFVGSDPNNLKKDITNVGKEQRDAIAKNLAARNKAQAFGQLRNLAGFVVGAELLLGDLIGTTGAAIAGISASLLQQFVMGDPARAQAVISTFNSLIAQVIARISSLNVLSNAQSAIGTLLSGLSSKFNTTLAAITTSNNIATKAFSAAWASSTKLASGFINTFSLSSVKRLGKIGLLVAGLTAAFATMASASEGEGETAGVGFGALGFTLLAFGDTILSYLLPALGKLGKGFIGVGKSAATNIGKVAFTALRTVGGAVSSVAAGIPIITASFLAAGAAITAAGLGGLIYSAFFGEGDSFLERVKNNFDGVLAYFNLLNVSVADTRKEALKTIKNIEKLAGQEFNINLSAQLENVDLSNASDRELINIERAVKDLDKNRIKADRERNTFGAVTEETRKSIRAAVNAVENAIREGGGGATASGQALGTIRETLINVLEDQDRTVLARLFDGNAAALNELKKTISDERFSDLSDPDVARAFATQLQTRLGDVFDLLPESFAGIINQAANTGTVSTQVADALADLKATQDPELLAKILTNTSIQLPEGQLINLTKALELSNKLNSANQLIARQKKIAEVTSKAVGDEVSLAQIQALTNTGDLLEIERLVREISKIEKGFEEISEGITDPKRAQELIAAVQGDAGLEKQFTDLSRLNLELAAVAQQKLSFSIEPGTIRDLNKQLQEIGVNGIDKAVGEIFQPDVTSLIVDQFGLAENLKQLNKLELERTKLLGAGTTVLNQQDSEIRNLTSQIQFQVNLLNSKVLAETQGLSLLEDAASIVTDREITLNDILKLDNNTIKNIAEAQEKLIGLKIIADQFGQTPLIGGVIDGMTKDQVEASIAETEKLIKKLFSTAGKSTYTGPTIFEKFVGKLSDSGFAFDLKSASTLSKDAIKSLNQPLKAIEKAQKAITKSGLNDVSVRQRALEVIKKSREEIFKILQGPGSTVGQFQIGLEGMGLDPNLVFESEKALNVSKEIVSIQDKLNNLSGEDLETRMELNKQLEYQERLLDGITTKAEESADRIKESFAQGLQTLIKEGGKLEDFFDGLLDTLSNEIINTVVNSFVEAFFEASELKEMFKTLFSGLFETSSSAGQEIGDGIKEGINQGTEDVQDGGSLWSKLSSGFSSFFKEIGAGLSSLWSSLSSMFSNLFSGMSGGGGGFGSIFSGLGSSLGGLFSGFGELPIFDGLFGGAGLGLSFSQGGIVPNTPYSQIGKDSVPAMLTPGELVVPANKVKDFNNGGATRNEQVFNINVSGDVSRQTRKEIVKMLPEITSGVNMVNKENNFRR
jgi:tape measure domain-containing protein